MLRVDPSSLVAATASATDALAGDEELAALRAALAATREALADSRRRLEHLLGAPAGAACPAEEFERLRTILDAVPQMLWSHGLDGGVYYSRRFREFTGVPLGDPGAVERLALVHPDDRAQSEEAWRCSLAAGTPYEAQYRLRHNSGDYRWILSRAEPHRGPDGAVAAWYGSCTDIHARVLAQQAVDDSERLNRGIIEASPDCVSLLDLDGTQLFVNAAALRAHRLDDSASLVGRRWGERFPEPVRELAEAALARAQAGEAARLLVQSGSDRLWWDIVLAPVRDECGKPIRIVVIARDVTDQKLAEEKAQWAAHHDVLTGLPNRFLLQKRVDAAIESARAGGGRFALLLLDVDDFKRINDSVGHDAGDALLCTFAERLRAALRGEDTIARLGGDEFAILLADAADGDDVAAAVGSIFDRLREPCFYAGRMLDCQASIGASLFPAQGRDRAELLKNADVALYAAKAAGGASLKLFQPEMRMEMQKRVSMLSLARDALREERIVPYYQPKIDLRSGAVAGFEALLRWTHHSKGVQSPATIAAAFEDLNLAAEISDCMVDAVIADAVRWRDKGVAFGHVAINAAAAEFRRGDFADKLLERLHRSGLPSSALQVEVTETVFLGRGADFVERALNALSAAGVGIALDDFGTGYASLSHLKQFPVDVIKIDRSFVRDIEADPGDAAIIDAVVSLGRSLGIRIVAEGIETDRQHDFLHSLGCDYGQGYLYGKAAPAADVPTALLERCPTRGLRLAG
jgi:diguanylate cyclase (GGDEF)-like protein/PAS domain S-box-containing protein